MRRAAAPHPYETKRGVMSINELFRSLLDIRNMNSYN